MAAAVLVRSVARKMSAPTHLVARGLHGSGPTNVQVEAIDVSRALDYATSAGLVVGSVALLSSAVYMHFWINPAREELNATLEELRRKQSMRQPQDNVRTKEPL